MFTHIPSKNIFEGHYSVDRIDLLTHFPNKCPNFADFISDKFDLSYKLSLRE